MTSSTASSWIVALDLRDRSRGALAFAGWLGAAGESVVGAYVLEAWSRPYIRGDIEADLRSAAARAAQALGCRPPERIVSEEAETAEAGLARMAFGSSGLIVGRVAAHPRRALSRLGPVARRLLRQLPAPVVVVPPTLVRVAAGPILLATDLGPASDEAVGFARDLAARLGRDLEVVHVGEDFYEEDDEIRDPVWQRARDAYRAEVAQDTERWASAQGLAAAPRHIRHGDPVLELADLAEARDAALVVVGSRRLGLPARFFLSSTASALAGLAACPVAVVPPRD
ncbi:universal stress protein [Nannocystis sp. ILAH1]|uniref:universal stress protein n=1 Tax=unclassified Nannocystis TaxID=2627009 RepID=UPI00226E2BCB|nr:MULTISPECIES: universal stress protein [unclassified Nannocystis]MCY0993956.1 universal stress protein [Nannocystis sp. ILAH1]MCY1066921.1 universal stress protein [Nannocystis sp. RBIL2]